MDKLNRVAPRLAIDAPRAEPAAADELPTWSKWREAFRVVLYPLYLRRTIRIALVVGTVIFMINHLDEVIMGKATLVTWVKGAVTYLVPFCVSNFGVLSATHRRPKTRR